MNLFKTARKSLRPYDYPWAIDGAIRQNRSHWLPEEVVLSSDIIDWKELDHKAKAFLTHLFRFFTQTELEVNNCYMKKYMNTFRTPEIQMMLSAFSNMETIHTMAYSYLIDELGLPEIEYEKFLKYKEITNQHDYLNKFYCDEKNIEKTAKTIAVFAAFTEGVHLFTGFIMLLYFQQINLMKGMCQIVTWATRDENLHVEKMSMLYKQILIENPEVNTEKHKASIVSICKKMIRLEDAFIDLCFENGDVRDLKAKDVKKYSRFLANHRMGQIGLERVFNNVKKNPLPWSDWIINGIEHTNFFENRSTEYTKASTSGDWDVFEECEACQ